jgi:hypothetical protein
MTVDLFTQIQAHLHLLAGLPPSSPSKAEWVLAQKDFQEYFIGFTFFIEEELGIYLEPVLAAINTAAWAEILLLQPPVIITPEPEWSDFATCLNQPDLKLVKNQPHFETLVTEGQAYNIRLSNADQTDSDYLKLPFYNAFRQKAKFPYYLAATLLELNIGKVPCHILKRYYLYTIGRHRSELEPQALEKIWYMMTGAEYQAQLDEWGNKVTVNVQVECPRRQFLFWRHRRRRQGLTLQTINNIVSGQTIYSLKELHLALSAQSYSVDYAYLKKLNMIHRFVDKGRIIESLRALTPAEIHKKTSYSFATIRKYRDMAAGSPELERTTSVGIDQG